MVCILRTKSSICAERGGVLVDDDVDAVVERRQVRVGDDARDLDDRVLLDVETRHLEVEPHQVVVVGASGHERHAIGPPTGLGARVRFGRPMIAPPVVWRPDEALLRDSNVARFMAAERIDDFADAGAALDRRAGVVLGRGRAVPRSAVRHSLRRACSTPRPASSGRRGSSAAAATPRRCASTRLDADRPGRRSGRARTARRGRSPAPSCGR